MDSDNPATFLNKTGSAKAAGYKAGSDKNFGAIGCQNYEKLRNQIDTWVDEEGLSEETLKKKLTSLMTAKQTHFIKAKGAINEDDLPPGYSLVGITGTLSRDKGGEEVFGDGDSIIQIDMDALETQRRTLDMAIKVKGMNAPEKRKYGMDEETVRFIMNIGKKK